MNTRNTAADWDTQNPDDQEVMDLSPEKDDEDEYGAAGMSVKSVDELLAGGAEDDEEDTLKKIPGEEDEDENKLDLVSGDEEDGDEGL